MARGSSGREFKLEAVRLVEVRGATVAQAAPDFDIHDNVLAAGFGNTGKILRTHSRAQDR